MMSIYSKKEKEKKSSQRNFNRAKSHQKLPQDTLHIVKVYTTLCNYSYWNPAVESNFHMGKHLATVGRKIIELMILKP